MSAGQGLYLMSQTLLAAANWFLLAVIARILSVEQTGLYNLTLAIQAPVFLLFSLQLKNHYLTQVSPSEEDFIQRFWIRFFLIPVATILALGIAFIFEAKGEFFWGVAFLKSSELIFELPFMREHKLNRLVRASSAHILRSVFTYGVLTISLFQGLGVFLAFGLASGASLLFTFAYWIFCAGGFRLVAPKLDVMRGIAVSCLPLGASAALLSLNVSLPRFYLNELIGKEAIALYSVSFAFYGLWQLFFNSYLNAMLPRFNETGTVEKFILPLGAFALFAAFFVVFDDILYSVLFGSSYGQASSFTYGLLVSTVLSFFTSFLFFSRMSQGLYGIHLRFNVAALVFNAVALGPAIKYFGPQGSYISWSASLCLLCMLYLAKPISRAWR